MVKRGAQKQGPALQPIPDNREAEMRESEDAASLDSVMQIIQELENQGE